MSYNIVLAASKKTLHKLTNHWKYWILVLLFNYGLTIGIHYLLRPLWFDGTDEHTGLTSFELLFTVVVLPVALVTINYWLAKKNNATKFFILNALMICSCIVISARLHFLNWADSIGSRTHPDSGTLEVIAFERSLGLVVTVIGLIIVLIRIYQKGKKEYLQHNESQPPTEHLQKHG